MYARINCRVKKEGGDKMLTRLKVKRMMLGLTQKQMARMLKWSLPYYNQVENGRLVPTNDRKIQLGEFFGDEFEWLMEEQYI